VRHAHAAKTNDADLGTAGAQRRGSHAASLSSPRAPVASPAGTPAAREAAWRTSG
jgi:hypothetical protein